MHTQSNSTHFCVTVCTQISSRKRSSKRGIKSQDATPLLRLLFRSSSCKRSLHSEVRPWFQHWGGQMPGGVVWPPPGKDFEHALIWCTLKAKSQYLAPHFEDLFRDGCLKHFVRRALGGGLRCRKANGPNKLYFRLPVLSSKQAIKNLTKHKKQ